LPALFQKNPPPPPPPTVAKYALVIGNSAYDNLTRLANPVNDADDVDIALRELGFIVDKLTNASLDQMESAIVRLKNRLSVTRDSYGFFFYAGHGVQSNGENYLIPVDANIIGESFLKTKSMAVQAMLDELNNAGNELNVVVLDACRDNPFGWGRSSTRGLVAVSRQPADSIIVYATSAGQQANDGRGRNGLFTSQLLPNLKTPGLEVKEVFNRTGADVAESSQRQQIPAVYNQFFGTAYLGSRPVIKPPSVFEAGLANVATGSLEISTITGGTVVINGSEVNQTIELPAWGNLPIEKINAGSYKITIIYEDGKKEEKTIEVGRSEVVALDFTYRPIVKPVPVPKAPKEPKAPREKRVVEDSLYYMNSFGASVGTSFAAPVFIGSLQTTLAPWKGLLFDLGMDFGIGSGESDVDQYSFSPFSHFGFFIPFTKGGGWYNTYGVSYMYSKYTFNGIGGVSLHFFTFDISTGFIFKNGFTISYIFRTDFETMNNKLSFGYSFIL